MVGQTREIAFHDSALDSYRQTLCRLSHTFLRYRPFRLSTPDPRLPHVGGEFQIRLASILANLSERFSG